MPKQLLVRATKALNNVTELPHGTSLLDIRAALPEPTQVTTKSGLRIYTLPAALIACRKHSFTQNPTDMRAALSMISDASEVLGHFIFVFIHPYMDGNGRTGRFLMNAMLASGGYPWTIVPLEKRNDYMAALEEASTNQNIEPFTKFLGSLVQAALEGKAAPPLPSN